MATVTGVSGNFVHGQSVVIGGLGFGAKTHAQPYKWDDFESGTIGADVGAPSNLSYDTSNWQTTNSGGVNPKYSNSQLRANSTRSLYVDLTSQYNCNVGLTWSPARQGFVYLSYWTYEHFTGGRSNNRKTFRQYGSNGQEPSFHYGEGADYSLVDTVDQGGGLRNNWAPGMLSLDGWHRHEWQYDTGTPGGGNGFARFYVDNVLFVNAANFGFLFSGSSYGWAQLRIGHYSEGGGVQNYVDDVYIDTTLQRVEIGNASNWSSCTHREIQIPTAWSDNSVTVNVNRGTFGGSANAYLFVVDATGSPSPGYAITFGSGQTVVDLPRTVPDSMALNWIDFRQTILGPAALTKYIPDSGSLNWSDYKQYILAGRAFGPPSAPANVRIVN